MTKVAIMQPTYLPWCGYFALIDTVDVFVLLDTVQFTRRSWQQRNRIKTANGPSWLTVPVISKGKRDQRICDVQVDTTRDFPANHIKSLTHNYSNTAYFAEYGPSLLEILGRGHAQLAALTIDLIRLLSSMFELKTPILLASDIEHTGAKAELLASICTRVGGDTYISPPGSKVYLDESNALERQSIDLRYFQYDHPVYEQLYGDFIPYLSAIDLLFNAGPASQNIIRSGCAQ